jgi:hypothetical protein
MPVPAYCAACETQILFRVVDIKIVDEYVSLALICPDGHVQIIPCSEKNWKLWKKNWLKE